MLVTHQPRSPDRWLVLLPPLLIYLKITPRGAGARLGGCTAQRVSYPPSGFHEETDWSLHVIWREGDSELSWGRCAHVIATLGFLLSSQSAGCPLKVITPSHPLQPLFLSESLPEMNSRRFWNEHCEIPRL